MGLILYNSKTQWKYSYLSVAGHRRAKDPIVEAETLGPFNGTEFILWQLCPEFGPISPYYQPVSSISISKQQALVCLESCCMRNPEIRSRKGTLKIINTLMGHLDGSVP